jgi:dTDP-D-glucose 4,6-dehydratase
MHSVLITGGAGFIGQRPLHSYTANPSGRDHRHTVDATNTDGFVIHYSAAFECGASRAYINNDRRHRIAV